VSYLGFPFYIGGTALFGILSSEHVSRVYQMLEVFIEMPEIIPEVSRPWRRLVSFEARPTLTVVPDSPRWGKSLPPLELQFPEIADD
jgi:hypothetical protein